MTDCADQSRRTTPAAPAGVACEKAVRAIYLASAAKLDAAVRASDRASERECGGTPSSRLPLFFYDSEGN